ncbi:hypothetical protein EUX98_g3068 [Antrodiella citrinella]|uniref:Uncharacterized protein n=1 Tax=Antrodiella citrinella TaxID=2447956 RepID=A0A4S4N5R4_9APHY|nr:hypothetical protein EUX98_g3068 [Antrodiella citrinella]
MTIKTFNLKTLKQVKNSVIGNPTAKLSLAQDDAFIRQLVDCINNPLPYLEVSQGSGDDIRIEAAHVIASISYGSSDALRSLLSVNALRSFIYAISLFQPTDPPALRSALTRALRALAAAIADAVGPEQWGLRTRPSEIRDECSVALDSLFEVEALDIYLPLLEDVTSQASGLIAQLLGAALRSEPHRVAVTNWQPPVERNKEVKGKRGWERTELGFVSCWTVRHLVALLHKKDIKEAALSALASLAKDDKDVAGKMSAESPDQRAALPLILSLCKSRNVELQLAACLCAANVIRACITPTEPPNTWDEDEPESISFLREAAFTAIAAIALFENDTRCEITDNLHLIPYIQISLSHRHVGVRYAACQCVRSLSRAVAVVRTNIVDTGLGMSVFQMLVNGIGKEDRRVMLAVSYVMCNLVNDFSPLRQVLLEQGVISKLIQLLHSDDPGLRLNALWALKNLLFKSNTDVKQQVIVAIGGWTEVASLLNLDTEPGLQEQAFHIVRHVADCQEGAEMVFEGLGDQVILGSLSNALESEDEDVVHQAVCLLGNLANSYNHQHLILSHPRILASLRTCLIDAKVQVRRPAAACILELARGSPGPHSRKEMHDAGIDSTLRHICDSGYAGTGGSFGGAGSPIARTGSGFQMGMEDDTEVKEKAREALQWLERGSDMVMF